MWSFRPPKSRTAKPVSWAVGREKRAQMFWPWASRLMPWCRRGGRVESRRRRV